MLPPCLSPSLHLSTALLFSHNSSLLYYFIPLLFSPFNLSPATLYHSHIASFCLLLPCSPFFFVHLHPVCVFFLPPTVSSVCSPSTFLRLGGPLTSKAIKIFVGSSTNTLHSLPTTTSSMLQIYCYKNRHLCKKSLIATGISSSLYWSMWLVLCCMISVELIRLSS